MEKTVPSPLAQFLKSAIEKRGVSMRAASLYAGLNPAAVYYYISGRNMPDPESCRKLADYFGVPQEYVLQLAGHLPGPPEQSPQPIPELEAVIQRVAQLPVSSQRLVAAVLYPLAEAPMLQVEQGTPQDMPDDVMPE